MSFYLDCDTIPPLDSRWLETKRGDFAGMRARDLLKRCDAGEIEIFDEAGMICGHFFKRTEEPVSLAEPPEELRQCDECGGEGEIAHPEIVSKWSDDPYYCRVESCRACGGQGDIITEADGLTITGDDE